MFEFFTFHCLVHFNGLYHENTTEKGYFQEQQIGSGTGLKKFKTSVLDTLILRCLLLLIGYTNLDLMCEVSVSDVNLALSADMEFFKDFIYLFLERGEGREKEREKNINVWLPLGCPLLGTWPATQACALTGNQTGNCLVCWLVLNLLSHTNQGQIWNLS